MPLIVLLVRTLIYTVAILTKTWCGRDLSRSVTIVILDVLNVHVNLSRFDVAPLLAFNATKEMDYETGTDGRN